MVVHNERRLLSKVIEDGSIRALVERNIGPEWFTQSEDQTMAKFIFDWNAKYGQVPSPQSVVANFPAYQLVRVQDPVESLCDHMVNYRRRAITMEAVATAADMIEAADHESAAVSLRKALSELDRSSGTVTSDLELTKDPMQRFSWYEDMKNRPNGLLGLPTGFPTIDKATAGLQGGQLVTLIASAKVGKSVTSLQIATNVHQHPSAPSVMFQSFEMSNFEQQTRHDAMRAHISHANLRRGQLTATEEIAYREMLDHMSRMDNALTLTDSTAGTTVSMLASKIDDLGRPDLIVIDGVYLMIDEISGEQNTPISITNITRSLKRLAQQIDRPFLITTQALTWKMRKTRLSGDSVGYCVDDATEIMTKDRGFVTRDELSVGDLVLTLNHVTGKSEWQPVQAVNVFPARTRSMLRMKTKNHSSLTTLQHRWPTVALQRWGQERRWATSATLKDNDRIINCAPHQGFPVEAVHTDELVELVAWFYTEGSVTHSGTGTISQDNSVNAGNVDRIRSSLEKVFGPPTPVNNSYRHVEPVWRETIRKDRSLVEFWLSKSATKILLENAPSKVPSFGFLCSLTKPQLELFIEVSYLADGHNPVTRAGNALSQKDRKRSEAFQYALILAGRSTSLLFRKGSSTSCPMWQVSERTSTWFAPIPTGRLTPESFQIVEHDGPVWCPTTDNHTWLARRDGRVYFTGNSSSFVQDSDVVMGLERVDDEMDDARILRVLMSRNCGPVETILRWDFENGRFEEEVV